MDLKGLLTVVLCLGSITGIAQINAGDSTAKATELVNIEQKLMDGVATGDTALWKHYLSKDFMIVNEDGSRTFYTDFVNSLRPMAKGVSGNIKVQAPHFTFIGNVAILNYVADEHEDYHGNQLHTSYGTMVVYQRINNNWVLMNSEVFEIPALPPAIAVADDILRQYTGNYFLTPETLCSVILEDHHLYLQRKGKPREELFAETNTIFFKLADTRGRKLFEKDKDGKWLMRERRNGQDVVWRQ